MGDLLPSIPKSTFASEVDGNASGYESYGSDAELAAVQLFKDYPDALLAFASACCVLFMLVGIPGNLITIVALARCKKVRNATAVFIMNLSCSDLLFCCFNLPLAASTFWRRAWAHGRTLCKLFPLARYALVAVSLFTVLAITINRYVMISHPRVYPKDIASTLASITENELFCCFNLPLAASTFWRQAWAHGRTLCKLFPLARYALEAVSLFTVLAITINRYVMISHPRVYPKLYKQKYLAVMVASTWIFSFGALIATFLEKWGRFGLDPSIGSCSILPDKNNRSPKEFLFVGAFMLPCLAIVICYARIFFIVREAAKKSRAPAKGRGRSGHEDSAVGSASTALAPSPCPENGTTHISAPKRALLAPPTLHYPPTPAPERSSSSGVDTLDGHDEEAALDGKRTPSSETAKRLRQAAVVLKRSPASIKPPRLTHKDRKLLKMIMAIMLSFWVCYLPITLTKIFREFTSHPVTNIAGYLLIYLTTCINPIIYVVMSSEYRQAYKNLLMCRRWA